MMIPVLDHGYVALVTHWGSEEQIIEAAPRAWKLFKEDNQ